MCEGGDCCSYPTSVVEEAGEGIYKKLAFDEEICSRPPPNKNSIQAIYTKSFIRTLDRYNMQPAYMHHLEFFSGKTETPQVISNLTVKAIRSQSQNGNIRLNVIGHIAERSDGETMTRHGLH